MTSRAAPFLAPHHPESLFDAVFAAMPEAGIQVTWADRQLGALTVLTTGNSHKLPYWCTLYLRPAADGHTVVHALANRAGEHRSDRDEAETLDRLVRFVADLATSMNRSEPR